MARAGYKEVVRLDITVDESKTMGFLDGQYHLSNVKARHGLMQDVFSDQQTQKIASRHVLHDKIEV